MPRTSSRRIPTPQPTEKITIAEATKRCGWQRANTFRERALGTETGRRRFALEYDAAGRAIVDAGQVFVLVDELTHERARRGNWRVRNLGAHALPRGQESKRVSSGSNAGGAQSRIAATRPGRRREGAAADVR